MRGGLLVIVCSWLVLGGSVGAVADAAPAAIAIRSGVVTREDLPAQPGSEPDTVAEPDVAVNPKNADNAIAVAHDSRYPDAGAVGISAAWTTDGGARWQHAPVPGLTVATGGSYQRASDPVVAFSADGTAYMSTVLVDVTDCDSAVAVIVSRDGGRQWGVPHFAHQNSVCTAFDDKPWVVVDTSPASPHAGRVYVFWTAVQFSDQFALLGEPQAVRWSDDGGRTWSATHYVNYVDHNSQNSQPIVRFDGTVVDTYYDSGDGGSTPDLMSAAARGPAGDIDATGTIYASTSRDGGQTWSAQVEVAHDAAGSPPGVRCCLFSATVDAVTQRLHVAWEGGVGATNPVYTAWSDDGRTWSPPVRITPAAQDGVTYVNVTVAALAGAVYVSYGIRALSMIDGGIVEQALSVSVDGGHSFRHLRLLGPPSLLRYAAQVGGDYFPGDYIGSAVTAGRLYLVWPLSSAPSASPGAPYHQVIWGATLRL